MVNCGLKDSSTQVNKVAEPIGRRLNGRRIDLGVIGEKCRIRKDDSGSEYYNLFSLVMEIK